ncbi:hypothetical protein HHK36_031348 [Tetracentron sinense]|uniref:Uncharacterized protein n=1 Tax=Tetracentron sinense TaxID=13715 RepID=A0A834YB21_TETSI|nr:hypothetical protein HHK36_031348 [Tetracentron sinense]
MFEYRLRLGILIVSDWEFVEQGATKRNWFSFGFTCQFALRFLHQKLSMIILLFKHKMGTSAGGKEEELTMNILVATQSPSDDSFLGNALVPKMGVFFKEKVDEVCGVILSDGSPALAQLFNPSTIEDVPPHVCLFAPESALAEHDAHTSLEIFG